MASSPDTILVYVGLDLMGDGLMKLPFVRTLRKMFPNARITWLAGKGASVYGHELAPLVGPFIDEVIDDAGIGTHWWELLRRPLPGRRFDLVIDTQRRVLTSLIVRRIGHGTFISAAADFKLSDRAPAKDWTKPPAMIRQILELIEIATGEKVAADATPIPLPEPTEQEAQRRLPGGPVYIGLAPGAGGRHKCWPLESYIALAMRQAKLGRVPVVFLGPGEREWEGEIRDAVPAALLPLDGVGGPDLTIALAKRLRVAVANDSGTGHMIAAAGIPQISLFGPTAPEKFAPLTPNLSIIRAQDFGDQSMQSIPLEAVADTVERIISGPSQGL